MSRRVTTRTRKSGLLSIAPPFSEKDVQRDDYILSAPAPYLGVPVIYVVSKDGKTLTLTAKGVNAEGEKFSNTGVFDKQ